MTSILPVILLSLSACLTLASVELPEPFAKGWDEAVGLWHGSTTHGPEGHDIRANAGRLFRAGVLGLLDQVPATRVLANLRKAQATTGGTKGNFWWAWEDKQVTDRNSGFFTVMALLPVFHEFRDQLDEPARKDLAAMLDAAETWFATRAGREHPQERDLRYPNAFFGDAAMLWLLRERRGEVDPTWRKTFTTILRYYDVNDWGWGEHLSDMYCKVIQNELLALKLWAKQLDEEQVALVDKLWMELETIDLAFAGGPRVPTIRCYWVESSPGTPDDRPVWFKPYREQMTADKPTYELIAHLAAKRGIYADPVAPVFADPSRTIDCHGGSKAFSWVTPRYRYGTLTRWPLFPDQSQTVNTLCSTTMPVAFWHVAGDWGYLQWLTVEKGIERWQPMQDRKHKHSRKEGRLLTDGDKRARHGWTAGTRLGDALVVLRELAVVPKTWTLASDGFRLLEPSVEPVLDEVDGWHRLVLDYGNEVVTVACKPLSPGHAAELQRVAANVKGKRECTLRVAAEVAGVAPRPDRPRYLWFIRAGKEAVAPPAADEHEGTVTVELPGQKPIRIDDVRKGWRSE